MGDVLKAYFVPNGSYLMEMAEDGDAVSAVEALQEIGREIRTTLRPDAIVVASPHWLPKSAFFADEGAQHESFNDYPLRPAPFGRRFFSYTAAGDPVLARAILDAAREAGLPVAPKVYGFDHGAFCLGCCWALMTVLVVVGLMNLAWMIGLFFVFLAEKSSAHGLLLAKITGAALVVLGVVVIAHPGILSTIS